MKTTTKAMNTHEMIILTENFIALEKAVRTIAGKAPQPVVTIEKLSESQGFVRTKLNYANLGAFFSVVFIAGQYSIQQPEQEEEE